MWSQQQSLPIILLAAFTTCLASPASAQDSDTALIYTSTFLYSAFLPAVMLLAHRSFATQHERNEGWVFPPRYLMRRGPYVIGLWAYIGLACALFVGLKNIPDLRNQLVQFATIMAPGWNAPDGAGELAIFALCFAIMGLLLTQDAPVNPFTHFRFLFCKLAAVPDRVDELVHGLRNLTIPSKAREAMLEAAKVGHPVLYLSEETFNERNCNVPEFRWALISHLYHVLCEKEAKAQNRSFFIDPNMNWRAARNRYEELAGVYRAAGRSRGDDPLAWKKALEALSEFEDRITHLMAYFLISNNSSEEAIWEEARSLGAFRDMERNFAPDPWNTISALVVSVAVMVLISTTLGLVFLEAGLPLFSDWGRGQELFGLKRHFDFDQWPDIDWIEMQTPILWAVFAVVCYTLPMLFTLGFKYVAYLFKGEVTVFRWHFILVFLMLGYAGSSLGLSGLTYLLVLKANGKAEFLQIFSDMAHWAIAPALLSALLTWVLHFIQRRKPADGGDFAEDPLARLKQWWSGVTRRKRSQALGFGLAAGFMSASLTLLVAINAPQSRHQTFDQVRIALGADQSQKNFTHINVKERCDAFFGKHPRAFESQDVRVQYCWEYTQAEAAGMRILAVLVSFFTGFGLFASVFIFNIGLAHHRQKSLAEQPLFDLLFGAGTEKKDGRVVLDPAAPDCGILFSEGSEANAAYLVTKGRLLVYRDTDKGEIRIAEVGADDIIGEYALILRGAEVRRSASVRALEPSEVIEVSPEMFQAKLNSVDPFVRRLIQIVVRREIDLARRLTPATAYSEYEPGVGGDVQRIHG